MDDLPLCSILIYRRLPDANEQTGAHPDGLLVGPRKAVIVSGFDIPAEAVSAGRPEHKVPGYLSSDRIACPPVLFKMDPLGTDTEHELGLPRDGPRLLEQQIGVPLGRVSRKERGNTCLKFEPVFDRCDFRSEIGGKGRCPTRGIPTGSGPDLEDDARIVIRRTVSGCSRLPGPRRRDLKCPSQ